MMRKIRLVTALFVTLCIVPPAAESQKVSLGREIYKAIKESKKETKNKPVSEEMEDNPVAMTQPSNDEVTLTVSADGATKEEATKSALRSAIEQAYGTFVSANTSILNDELVKDEIVTVTSGNIKEYKEIASETVPNGKVFVTLRATISISKLVSYAQSKGSSAEFAGAAFGMNMKMKELNKENELTALNNLLIQVSELIPYVYDRVLTVDEPINITYDKYVNYYINSNELIESALKKEYGITEADFDYYLLGMLVDFVPNENYKKLCSLIHNTLSSLSLSGYELEEYKNTQIPTSEFRTGDSVYILRNDKELMKECGQLIYELFLGELEHFYVVDNLGVRSSVDFDSKILDRQTTIRPYIKGRGYKKKDLFNLFSRAFIDTSIIKKGEGLFKVVLVTPYIMDHGGLFDLESRSWSLSLSHGKEAEMTYNPTAGNTSIKLHILIPKSDIGKYTQFEVIR